MRTFLLIVLLCLTACSGESLTVDLSAATVELDVYSGLPNPRWQLNPEEVDELEDRLSGLPETTRVEIPGQLGYRGFGIHDAEARITVTNSGYVVVHHDAGDKFYRDTKDVRPWLERQADARGFGNLLRRPR